jgi:hypothetical protein
VGDFEAVLASCINNGWIRCYEISVVPVLEEGKSFLMTNYGVIGTQSIGRFAVE